MEDLQAASPGGVITPESGQQTLAITASTYPALYCALQCSSADELLQAIGIDPASITDQDDAPNVGGDV